MRKWLALLTLSAMCAMVQAPAAQAQTFRGTVVDDSTGLPLDGATLTILDSRGAATTARTARSDSAGRFILHAPGSGRYALRVTRIGYAPLTSATVAFLGGEAATINLRMSAVPQRLGSVLVSDRRRLNGYELLSDLGFELRRSKGDGVFLDSIILKDYKEHPIDLVLTQHPGLTLILDFNPGRRERTGDEAVRMISGVNRDASPRLCSPELWIDSFQQKEQWRLRTLRAEELFGIEVFKPNRLPSPSIAGELGMAMSAATARARCGMIVVWTKGFIEETKKKREKRAP